MTVVGKKNRLYDVTVREVTLTKSPAVAEAAFLVIKSKDPKLPQNSVEFRKSVVIKAVDDEKRIVYGYAMIPHATDSQDDDMTPEEVEKAAHKFGEVLSKRDQLGSGTGSEHEVFDGIGHVVESSIDRDGSVAKSLGSDVSYPGGWFIGVKVTNDEIWKGVKDGEIKGFSIGGVGKREPIDEPEEDKASEGFLAKAARLYVQKACAGGKKAKKYSRKKVKKEAMSYDEASDNSELKEELYDMYWAFGDSFFSILSDPDVKDKISMILESVDQFRADLEAMGTLTKNNNIEGDDAMTPEQMAQITGPIEKLTAAVNELVTKMTKSDPPPADPPKADPPKADSAPAADDAITKRLNDLATQVENLAKTVTPRKGDGDGTDQPTKKSAGVVDIKKGQGIQGTAYSFRLPVVPQ